MLEANNPTKGIGQSPCGFLYHPGNSSWRLILIFLLSPSLPFFFHYRPACSTDVFLWQILSPQEKSPGTSKLFDDVDDVSGTSQDGSNGCYKYLGSIFDLQSCEITALSVRSPLLATGLANGKIVLWRWQLVILKRRNWESNPLVIAQEDNDRNKEVVMPTFDYKKLSIHRLCAFKQLSLGTLS